MIPNWFGSPPKVSATPRRRCVSEPLLQLLQAAGLSPAKIFSSLERQSRLYGYARLYPGHPYVRRLRLATGLPVVGLRRANHHLLVDIDRVHCSVPWSYREFSRHNCQFACTATIPETVKLGLTGSPLATLIMPHACLSSPIITSVTDASLGLSVAVKPIWHVF